MSEYELQEMERIFIGLCQKKDFSKAFRLVDGIIDIYTQSDLGNTIEFARNLHDFGIVAEKCNDIEIAIEYYCRSIKIKQDLDYEMLNVCNTIERLGNAYYKKSMIYLGIQMHEKVYNIRVSELGESDMETLYSLYSIGKGYYLTGKFEKGLGILDKCINKMKFIDDVDNEELIDVYELIADCCYNLGNYKRSIASYETELYFIEKVKGYDPNLIAQCMNRLAVVYEKSGFIENALMYYEETVTLKDEIFEVATLNTMMSYYRLGKFCYEYDYMEKSKRYYMRAYTMATKLLNSSHKIYTDILNELSLAFLKLGDSISAKKCNDRSVKCRKEYFADDFYAMSESYLAIAKCYRLSKQYDKAFEWLKSINELIYTTKSSDEYNRIIVLTYIEMAECLKEMSGHNGAIAMLIYAVELESNNKINVNNSKNDSNNYKDTYVVNSNLKDLFFSLSDIYIHENRYDESIEYLNKALEIYSEMYHDKHIENAEILKRIAKTYKEAGDYTNALNVIKEVIEIEDACLDVDSPMYIETMILSGDLYYELGNYKKAMLIYEDINDLNIQNTDRLKNEYATTLIKIALCKLNRSDKQGAKEYKILAEEKQKESNLKPEIMYNHIYKVYNIVSKGSINRSINVNIRYRNSQDCTKQLNNMWEMVRGTQPEYVGHKFEVAICLAGYSMHTRVDLQEKNNNDTSDIWIADTWIRKIEDIVTGKNRIDVNVLSGQSKLILGEYKKAMNYFVNSKKIAESLNETDTAVYCRNLYFFGEWYATENDVKSANNLYKEWHKLHNKLKFPFCNMYEKRVTKIAEMNFEAKNYMGAMEYYVYLMKNARRNYHKTIKHLTAVLKVAHLYVLMNEDERGIKYLNECNLVANEIDKYYTKHMGFDKIGRLYILAGEIQKGVEVLTVAYNRKFSDDKSITQEGIEKLMHGLKILEKFDDLEKVKNDEEI